MRSIAISESIYISASLFVFLCVGMTYEIFEICKQTYPACLHISKTTCSNFTKFSIRPMLPPTIRPLLGFSHENYTVCERVMFSHNGPLLPVYTTLNCVGNSSRTANPIQSRLFTKHHHAGWPCHQTWQKLRTSGEICHARLPSG